EIAGIGAANGLRVAAGALVAFAAATLLVGKWRRGLAKTGLALVAFMALATATGALGRGSAELATSGALAIASVVGFACWRGAPASRGFRWVGDAWRVAALVSISTGALALAAAAPMRDLASAPSASAKRKPQSNAIDLEMNRWQGKSLAETGLLDHVPSLK